MTGCIFARLLALLTSKKPIILMLMFMAAFVGLLPVQLEAQSATTPATKEALANGTPQRSVRELLGPYGTLNLNSGYKGSLDAQGYKIVAAPGEAPRLVPDTAKGDARWTGDFFPMGADDSVNVLLIDASGNLIAGGNFTTIGGVPVNYIARWDGYRWSAVGTGINGLVYALALDANGNLYAGGKFTKAGDVEANCIAKWNGREWSALGTGMDDKVIAIALGQSGNIYAGGWFTVAGGVTTNYLAKWDGNSWSALGSGMNDRIYTLAVDRSGHLYAGGDFTRAGGAAANHIAKWDGNAWSALGSGMSSLYHTTVYALALDGNGILFAGGRFSSAGGVEANCIARWNGWAWSALGSGVASYYDTYTSVQSLYVDGSGNLYAGGEFGYAGGVEANSLAIWNGSAWSTLGSGMVCNQPSYVAAILIDGNGVLYAGGMFNAVDGVVANNIARWSENVWSALGAGKGISSSSPRLVVSALAVDGNANLYAGGSFSAAGTIKVNNIAKWDGTSWSTLSSGINGMVGALVSDKNGNLYAGGGFTNAGGLAARNIAKWNGREWSALGSGMNRPVLALVEDGNGNLYAGGDFTSAGGIKANCIAKWNGSEWSALGKGPDGSVHALAVDGSGNLYAGGYFNTIGALTVNGIAKWDGSEWFALATGVYGTVNALVVDWSGNLYAGGDFIRVGGETARNIAMWNGSEWSALGSGMDDSVNALAVDEKGNIYAGGYFTTAGGITAHHIAKWNGREWSALGSGMSSSGHFGTSTYLEPFTNVSGIAVDGSANIYSGGIFLRTGVKPACYIAKWAGWPALAVDLPSEGLQLWDGSRKKISSQHPSVLSTWEDRLVVSFPELGLYLHDGSSWTKLSSLKSTESALGIADSLYVDAGAQGVYRYKGGWKKIHTSNPTMMASCGEKLVANFPDIGIWTYDGSEWKKISSWTTAEQMVGIQQRLFVDFGAKGIYRYDGSWVRTTKNNPSLMHAFGTALVASIDSASARGIYLYQSNSWKKISSNASAEGFASTPFTLYIDRGTQGISKYEKKAWKEISHQDPAGIAIYGGKLVASLPDKGLYLYSNPGWSILSTSKDAGKMQGVLFE
ncbi:MAG: hypothetical protein AB9866_02340 [Syntrophobacteraceae bacterium]